MKFLSDKLLVGIILLILGLVLVVYASVSIFSYFWILH